MATETTYYAAKDMSIQSHPIKAGDALGAGDVGKGKFKAARGLEKAVECGHIIPRLADGRVVTELPGEKSEPQPDASNGE